MQQTLTIYLTFILISFITDSLPLAGSTVQFIGKKISIIWYESVPQYHIWHQEIFFLLSEVDSMDPTLI